MNGCYECALDGCPKFTLESEVILALPWLVLIVIVHEGTDVLGQPFVASEGVASQECLAWIDKYEARVQFGLCRPLEKFTSQAESEEVMLSL